MAICWLLYAEPPYCINLIDLHFRAAGIDLFHHKKTYVRLQPITRVFNGKNARLGLSILKTQAYYGIFRRTRKAIGLLERELGEYWAINREGFCRVNQGKH